MKHILLSTIQSFVCVVLVTMVSFAVNAQDKGGGVTLGGPTLDVYLKQSCTAKQTEVTDSFAKAQGYCGDSGGTSCMSSIKDCLNNNSDEDLDSSDDSPDNSGQCYAFGYQNYKSDLKDMKSDAKDSQKTSADLLKDRTSAQKDYNDQKAKLSDDQHSALDDYNSNTLKDKDDQRKAQSDQKASQDDLKSKQRDMQMQILTAQQQQSAMTSDRATKINNYTLQILKCKSDAQGLQTQRRQDQNAAQNNGLSSLAVKSGQNANDVTTYYNTCVKNVLATRDDDANKYQLAMNRLDAQITQFQQQLSDIQGSLSMAQSQAQQQTTDDANKATQRATSYMAKQQNLSKQMDDLTQNFMQQSQQLGQQIAVAQQDNNINSDSLKKFKGQSPPKVDTTMNSAYESLNKAQALCDSDWTGCAQPTSVCSQFKSSSSSSAPAAKGAKGTSN